MSLFPSTVQAFGIAETGSFEKLQKLTLPFPTIEPGHILIKVAYFGVNFIDTYYRQGLYPFKKPLPAAIGKEAAGTIIALPTDEAILNSEEYKKRGYIVGGKVGVDFFGAHGEYVSVPWKLVYPVPESVPLSIVAAALLQGITALTFIEEAYNVQKGDVILVHTVAGGLGLLFCQLIKLRGATVIGTTSTPEKAALAKQFGADHVILYKQENTVQRVLELTNGEGVHAIFDGVGKDTFWSNFEMIRRKGTFVSVGNASGPAPPVAPLKLVEKNVKLVRPTMANYCYTAEEIRYYNDKLWPLIQDGALKVNIFKQYSFTTEGGQQAQRDLVEGRSTGKLIIDVSRTSNE